MGDWLGTGTVAPKDRVYLSFEEARKYMHSLKLENTDEWIAFTRSDSFPENIPQDVYRVYKSKGWKGMGDWLGTGNVANKDKVFRPFAEARRFVRSLELKNNEEWRNYTKSNEFPRDLPTAPHNTYKNDGWEGYGDWLGTGYVANREREYLPFEETKKFARSLKLKTRSEWQEYKSNRGLPENIPADPVTVYKGQGWQGMGDWLGTGTIANQQRVYRPFEQARHFARSLNIKSRDQWLKYARCNGLPEDIPMKPERVYKNAGWCGVGDWIGTGETATQNRQYRPFKNARVFSRSLNLKNGTRWRECAKSGELPSDIPSDPGKVYKQEGWAGMGDWLGTGRISNRDREFQPFADARTFVQTLGLRNNEEWREYAKSRKRPADIPSDPARVYQGKGWCGFKDWLGND
jgi:hypothetical protein